MHEVQSESVDIPGPGGIEARSAGLLDSNYRRTPDIDEELAPPNIVAVPDGSTRN
jgi:hypothetical protein